MASDPRIQMMGQQVDTATPLSALSRGIAEKQRYDQELAMKQQEMEYKRQLDQQQMALNQMKMDALNSTEEDKKAFQKEAVFFQGVKALKGDNTKLVEFLSDPRWADVESKDDIISAINSGDPALLDNEIAMGDFMIDSFGKEYGYEPISSGSGASKSTFEQKLALINSDPATANLPDAQKLSIITQLEKEGAASGTGIGKAKVALGGILDSANIIKLQIQSAMDDKGKSKALGIIDANTPTVKGSDAYNFKQKVEQLEGSAFLQAYETLRGAGQITEAEGIKATKAKSRMLGAATEAAFDEAAKDFLEIVDKAVDRAKNQASGNFGAQSSTIPDTLPAPPSYDGWSVKRVDKK